MTIGERIKERRKKLGMTVDDLAAMLGKNRATVYRYESNEIEKLPTTILEPLAKALGTTPSYLMGWDEIEEKTVKGKAERISEAIEKSGYSYPELSELTGISKSSLQRYATGETKNIPIDCVEKIAEITGVSAQYLMCWDSEEVENKSLVGLQILTSQNIRMIPLYKSVSAGFGAYADSCQIGWEPVYFENDYDAENSLAIVVEGDSMYPKIENGDTVIVRKQSDFENGNIVVVLIDGEEGLVKKIHYDEKALTLISLNHDYQDKEFKGEEMSRVRVVGVVKKIIKNA